ncbi:hypothetical protein NEOLI_000667 [Neolecta irregularis DAH-3]|uniref:Uncharacterized protein n=1 Tax=Neolecta irregularis (strain DAH-3) TaxID=1198029 RepID=A0A1U7LVP0_NEOID|nr:hypothetical protein NEOLI_000667 [Neolecta irregularis DAH-3]|eukprot:OLL26740.1 hypothetical protein NEOLI_000667 [Neolecta irregularis DAH-3]
MPPLGDPLSNSDTPPGECPEESDPLANCPEDSDPLANCPEESDPLASCPDDSDPLASCPDDSDPLANSQEAPDCLPDPDHDPDILADIDSFILSLHAAPADSHPLLFTRCLAALTLRRDSSRPPPPATALPAEMLPYGQIQDRKAARLRAAARKHAWSLKVHAAVCAHAYAFLFCPPHDRARDLLLAANTARLNHSRLSLQALSVALPHNLLLATISNTLKGNRPIVAL